MRNLPPEAEAVVGGVEILGQRYFKAEVIAGGRMMRAERKPRMTRGQMGDQWPGTPAVQLTPRAHEVTCLAPLPQLAFVYETVGYSEARPGRQ